jgi:TPR repeat protein
MKPKLWTKVCMCIALVVGLFGPGAAIHAADDTTRFNGTWEFTFPYNGQMLTMVSEHSGGTFKNHVRLPNGDTSVVQGQFSALKGRWTATADQPNDSGSYRFIDNDTVICTNAIGQTATWHRVGAAQHVSVPHPATTSTPSPGTVAAPDSPARASSLNPATNRAVAAFNRKDYNTAWREFMAAAQQGDSEAEAGIGAMLFTKINPPGTGFYAQCEKWLLASANQGNVKGMTFLAKFYYADGVNIAGGINPGINNSPIPPALRQQAEKSFAKAREWFERAAALGDGYAMGNLAIMLDAGVGGPRDPARAAQLRSGVAGHSDANFAKRATQDPGNLALAASWQAGHYAEAIQDAQALANKGNAQAQALLGRAYYEGVGVARNYPLALQWLNRAVAQNNADAMFFLGLMYEHGRGVPQDLPKSVDLFDRAAKLGQHYADMEVRGMRLQGESNRVAAEMRKHQSVEDIACATAGGVSSPGECFRGGETIDPFKPD